MSGTPSAGRRKTLIIVQDGEPGQCDNNTIEMLALSQSGSHPPGSPSQHPTWASTNGATTVSNGHHVALDFLHVPPLPSLSHLSAGGNLLPSGASPRAGGGGHPASSPRNRMSAGGGDGTPLENTSFPSRSGGGATVVAGGDLSASQRMDSGRSKLVRVLSNKDNGPNATGGTSSLASARSDDDEYSIFDASRNDIVRIAAGGDAMERERLLAIIDRCRLTWRHRLCCVFEGAPHDMDQRLSNIINAVTVFVVLVSITVFCIQTLPYFYANRDQPVETDPLFYIDVLCVVFFAIDVAARLICVPWSRVFNVLFLVDIVIITTYVIDNIVGSNISFVRPLRLLRMLRILKLSRYSSSLQLILIVLKRSFKGISMLGLPLLMVIVISSTIIYLFEISEADFNPALRRWIDPDTGIPIAIQSIGTAMWFACVTVATVGYGDVVPSTIGGKITAVFLQIVGVLTLSFPNVVLGANLERTFRNHRMLLARKYLTKKFRKVLNVVVFIRRASALGELRRHAMLDETHTSRSSTPQISARTGAAGTPILGPPQQNYMLTPGDIEGIVSNAVIGITRENIRWWKYRSIGGVEMLQTLLEVFSGVATVHELQEALSIKIPGIRNKDVAHAAIHLAKANYLAVFVLRRNTTHMVLALANDAVDELLVCREDSSIMPRRSAEYARIAWKQTTGQIVPFKLAPLLSTYPVWLKREKYVMHRGGQPTDFKLTVPPPNGGCGGAAPAAGTNGKAGPAAGHAATDGKANAPRGAASSAAKAPPRIDLTKMRIMSSAMSAALHDQQTSLTKLKNTMSRIAEDARRA